ncbi:hypothetical protein [Amycolatopsis sp. KNN50.9b]|uniref:hypothetical protein n=1 Tax=Amycolatopsis sp. KNN50.9b TaxID=2018303 RepID=UPI0018E9EC1B|nr:hypothetical protein [Amycolatopsis sp. KNN50.9b]
MGAERLGPVGVTDFAGLGVPVFLLVYAGLVLIPVVIRLVVPHLLRLRGGPAGPVSGPVRAIETVLADLVASQEIRVNSAGRLTTTSDRVPGDELPRRCGVPCGTDAGARPCSLVGAVCVAGALAVPAVAIAPVVLPAGSRRRRRLARGHRFGVARGHPVGGRFRVRRWWRWGLTGWVWGSGGGPRSTCRSPGCRVWSGSR